MEPEDQNKRALLKRPRGKPTHQTPRRPSKRTALRKRVQNDPLQENSLPKRHLTFQDDSQDTQTSTRDSTSAQGPGSWTEAEIRELVEFVLFHERDDKWPCHKRSVFWRGAETFIQIRCKTPQLRSGTHVNYSDYVGLICIHICHNYRICLSIQGGGLVKAEIPNTC